MDFLDYFRPLELERVKSKSNGEIVVVKSEGEVRLLVDGLTQSGKFIDQIWGKAISYLRKSKLRPKSCLVLGLGGGTVAGLISRAWPEAEIVGVEIDPVMIGLGRKYLGLGEITGLRIKIGEALAFVTSTDEKYGLILVDVYKGTQALLKLRDINKLRRILLPGGVVVFNFLFHTGELRQEAEKFVKDIGRGEVKLLRELGNLLVVVKEER